MTARSNGQGSSRSHRWRSRRRGAVYVLESSAQGTGPVLRRIEPSGELSFLYGRLPPCTGAFEWREGIWGATFPSAAADYAKLTPTGDLIVLQRLNDAGDPGVERLIRITPGGGVETLVDALGSPGATARQASKFAISSDGTLFVADAAQHAVLAVTPDGAVSTVAGSLGVAGNVDGAGEAVRFDSPGSIVWYPSGDLFVADQQGRVIRRITTDGVVSTLPVGPGAGDLVAPTLLVDASARLLVAHQQESFSSRLDAFSLDGGQAPVLVGLPEQAGSADGVGAEARFRGPRGMDSDGRGNVYIADGNAVVRKLSRRGRVTTVAGTLYPRAAGEPTLVDGPAEQARFASIEDVAFDRESGILYVADGGNDAVRRIDPDGTVSTLARVESGPPPMLGSISVAPGGDVVFVGSPYAGIVYRSTPEGELSEYAYVPDALSVAAARDGSVYVASGDIDGLNPAAFRLFVVSPGGSVSERAALSAFPGDMALDDDGRLFVVQHTFDPGASTVSVLDAAGGLHTILGDGIYSGVAFGFLDRAGVNLAWGLAVSGRTLFVSDAVENVISKLYPLPR